MWIIAFGSLAVFAVSSFWVVGLAGKIRDRLRKDHPDTLRQIMPDASASPAEHWIWQNPFNVAWAALPLIKSLDDKPLKRDATRMRTATIVGFVVWATMAAAFWMALTQPQ